MRLRRWLGASSVVCTISALGTLVMGETACPMAGAAVVAAAPCVAEILADAIKGMSEQQILSDVGPTCASNAEQVATVLLGSEDPTVQASPAYKAARASRAASMVFPPPAAFGRGEAMVTPASPVYVPPATQR